MARMLGRRFAWACLVWLATGCGRDREQASDATGEDAGTPDSGTSDGAIPDPNGTMDRATALTVGDFPGVFDSFDGREDKDFFSFDGTLGEWVTIRTIDKSGFSVEDTPLSLYGPDRVKLAGNRWAPSLQGENLLSRIITRLPATGRYYVGVADPGAPSESYGLSQPYTMSVVDADGTNGYTINVEGDEPTIAKYARVSTPGGELDDVFMAGTYDALDDKDAFAFDVAGGAARLMDLKVDTDGVGGNGSTSPPGDIWITDESGSSIIGRIDASSGQTSLTPPLAAGRYLLWTSHASTTPLGTNDFYVVRGLVAPDNPEESQEETNGALATAEPLSMDSLGAGNQLQAFIVLHLGDGDVDYFRLDATAGQTASVSCVSRGDGSGVIGMHVSVRDDSDESLAEAIEDPNASLSLDSLTVPASGKLYLRLWKDGQLPDVVGDWARCVIAAG